VIVSISRELGAGGGSLGEALNQVLGGYLLDERSIINELSQRVRLSCDYLEKRMEQPPTLGQTLISNLARSTAMLPGAAMLRLPEEEIIEAVRNLVLERAADGDVIVIGHGGIGLLGWRPSGIPVLAILLQAGREWRIDQLARRFSIDREEARRRIKSTDEARVRYQQHYFNSHMYDCGQYDLVLNTELLGINLAIELATRVVQHLTQGAAAAS
jgi:cytidylate kinase